jgi:replicative DNA helicase
LTQRTGFQMNNTPHSLEAEKALLGTVILNNEALPSAMQKLVYQDFFLDTHQRVFRAMCDLEVENRVVDFVTLGEKLPRDVAYIVSLIDGVPHSPDVNDYAETVANKSAARRTLYEVELAAAKLRDNVDAREVIGSTEVAFNEILSEGKEQGSTGFFEIGREVFQSLLNGGTKGFTTGIQALDVFTGGYRPKEFTVLAARTGDGKTSLLMQGAEANAAMGIPTLVFSLEMSRHELTMRTLSRLTGLNHGKLRDPSALWDTDKELIAQELKKTEGWPLWIEDGGRMHINKLVAKTKVYLRKGVKLVFVDYMGKVRTNQRERRLELAEVSATLNDMAEQNDLAIVALSQLSRPEGKDRNRKPVIYDLKESGEIENDADFVLMLYRPTEQGHDGKDVFTKQDEVIIGKARAGRVGSIPVAFHGSTLTYSERQP